MNKKLKIAYWVVMTLNAVVCIVDIATARFFGAAISGASLIWLGVCYFLADLISQQDELIASTLAELVSADTQLAQSQAREKIHHQLFAEMRERAQDAERKLKELEDDTPARGKNGRYVKRGL
jgi:hypothetical protein